MKKLGITKGEWKHSGSAIVYSDSEQFTRYICEVNKPIHDTRQMTKAESEANLTLILDAGNTYQRCNLLPSELLKQRDELLTAFEKIKKLVPIEKAENTWQGKIHKPITLRLINREVVIEIFEAAIKSAENTSKTDPA